ncbi:hypothetical protein Tco_0391705, partial [Tanacetum coccineum]
MIVYAPYWGLDIDIAGILFDDLISKLNPSGKKGRGKNICYVRFISLVIEHFLGEDYLPEILPYEEVSAEDTDDKSLSGTVVHPVSKPKAKTNKKRRMKKIPSSSEPTASHIV